jgi:hypothetical protein
MSKRSKPRRKRLEKVSLRAERREEPDWDRFAWALLQYARILADSQTAKGKPKP